MAAAGEAVLQYIDTHGLVDRVPRRWVDYLGQRLATLSALSIVGDVRGLGLLWGVELVRDKATREPFARARAIAERVAKAAFDRGLLVVAGTGAADGVRGDTISLAPPFILSDDEVDELAASLESSIRAVAAEEGFSDVSGV